jgi:hypothetical protein
LEYRHLENRHLEKGISPNGKIKVETEKNLWLFGRSEFKEKINYKQIFKCIGFVVSVE